MARTGSLRARLFQGNEGTMTESVAVAIEERLDDTERVRYRIPSTDSLTLDGDNREETIPAGGKWLAVVTDRRLLFAVETPDGETVREVRYTDLKDIELSTGLLGTTVTIDVWAVGTYEFSPSTSESLEGAVEFVDQASARWQQVVAALQEVDEQRETIRDHLEAGRFDAAADARAVADRQLKRAKSKTEGVGVTEALEERIRQSERAFDRARLEGRLARVETLRTEATHQADARAYTGAYERYQRARELLETALVIDIERDFGRAAELQAEIAHLDTQVENLSVRPMALAHQALERAEGTEKTDVKVQALRDAFEHYRDALTAGWGLDADFSEHPNLREHIESVVADLIETRRTLARELTEDGDRYRAAGDEATARERYEMAGNQLDAAEDLAREFRAGDCVAIRSQHGEVATRCVMAAV